MRLARLYAPGLPNLVEIRFLPQVAERWAQAVAHAPFDRLMQWLGSHAQAEGVRLHAWCLSPDSLRFLGTPAHRQSLPRTVQALGRRLAGVFGGSAYAGRYHSSLVEPGRWVLPCQVWIENTPVGLGHAPEAALWRWSSAAAHVGAPAPVAGWLHSHHDYWACGNTPFERQAVYGETLAQGLTAEQAQLIESAIRGQWALGSSDFVTGLRNVASRRAEPGRRGRPPKPQAS